MPIDNQYDEYYERIGFAITPEDVSMTDDEDRMVFVSLDHDRVYLRLEDNRQAFPVKIKGHEWATLWWMYRLSERKCMFTEYLSEYIIPVCRKYFIEEQRRIPKPEDYEGDES